MTNLATDISPVALPPAGAAPVVVIGAGPVGMRVVQELLRRNPELAVVIYGTEQSEPYNRVRLSSFLAGETDWESVLTPLPAAMADRVTRHYHCQVQSIDRDNKTVTDCQGRTQIYSALVIATGSQPFMPTVPGTDMAGVFTFRDMRDAQKLLARQVRSRKTLVVGGGVLGLEAARAMQKLNTQVMVVEHNDRLMHRQLDEKASTFLFEKVISLGIKIILGSGVREIMGDGQVTGVLLQNGLKLECDTIILSTGIRPNIDLARDSGLAFSRGIRVDDAMRTSDPSIYAVGECAEHRGEVYGLVAPGLEQAAVAAHSITGGKSRYRGSIAATRLKVIGGDIFSMGRVGEEENPLSYDYLTYEKPVEGIYRKLVLKRGRIVGAITHGSCAEAGRLQEAISHRRFLWPWQRLRFMRNGNIWPELDAESPLHWPAITTVCNCTGVTKGEIVSVVNGGCNQVECVSAATGASSVCGSCLPLIQELLGTRADPESDKVKGFTPLLVTSTVAALLGLLILLAAPIPFSDSARVSIGIDQLWRDGLLKQISGFTLAGLSLIGALLTFRKRWKKIRFGDFANWRVVHTSLGMLALFSLMAHTGFRLGENINLYLMLSFLGIALSGVFSSSVVAARNHLGTFSARRWKQAADWLHILVLWPLPALLGMHILSVYYF
jgi:nitrite reductase (NADH) large subunit